VGVVGVGRIGARHAETLRGLPAVASVVVGDVDVALAERVASSLGVEAAPSVEDLAAGVDALVVAAPTPAHISLLVLAAAAGLPTFCEKPVALELGSLDSAIAEIGSAGIAVQVGFQRRFDPGYRAARDAVAAGAVGELLVLRAATHDPVPPADAYIAHSGGIFRDLHIHDFDAIRFVTGREIVEVYADGAVRNSPSFEQYGDVDVAAALVRLDDGAVGVVTGARHDPRGYDVRLEIFGTGDSIAVGVDARSPYRSLEPDVAEPQAGYASFLDRFATAYRAELETFVTQVLTGAPSPCTLEDARAALAVAVAADRSRAERRPVLVEEVTPSPVA
jgi:myo-inositol 2-dehydrogenase/D-chiro-inositol 1-dehydrogenase